MPSRAIPAGWDWPQQSDGPVAPQAGVPASTWSSAPAAPQAPAPAQFAPPAGAPVHVASAAPAAQQSPYAPGYSGVTAASAVRAQRLCTHAQEIDAPSDVTRKVNIARGIAFGMLLLQVSLIILLIVSENMR